MVSFAVHIHSSLMSLTHLVFFAITICAFNVIIVAKTKVKEISTHVFSRHYMVSGLTLKPSIHNELIFVSEVRDDSDLTLLHVVMCFFQHHLLERLLISPL